MKRLRRVVYGLLYVLVAVIFWEIAASLLGEDIAGVRNGAVRTVLRIAVSAALGCIVALIGIFYIRLCGKDASHDQSPLRFVYALALMAGGFFGMVFLPGALKSGAFHSAIGFDLVIGLPAAAAVMFLYIALSRRKKKGFLPSVQESIREEAREERKAAAPVLKNLAFGIKEKARGVKTLFNNANGKVISSMFVMGSGQLMYKQWVKGALYLLVQAAAIVFFVLRGAAMLTGFFTLGVVQGDATLGITGDDSASMFILGLFSIIIIVLYCALYISNVKDAYETQKRVAEGKKPHGILHDIKGLADKKFYKTALAVPLVGVSIFNVLPIVFMILLAFTNYGYGALYPDLAHWTGFESFRTILALGEFATTFVRILAWNILWAAASTALAYLGGLGLALLYNKKCVKGKAIWRSFPVLAYAVPGFISLLAFSFMLSNEGPVNQLLAKSGGFIEFFGLNTKWRSRLVGLLISAWIGIPTSMLLATGILSNMNRDLYEAAEIDGAGPARQFFALTLPFVFFATTPVLITNFIGNFNNFGIFFFLRPNILNTDTGYFLASDTDLLINWLYRMSIDNNYYSYGAAISIIIFIITSMISLTVYVRSSAYKKEDTFR